MIRSFIHLKKDALNTVKQVSNLYINFVKRNSPFNVCLVIEIAL